MDAKMKKLKKERLIVLCIGMIIFIIGLICKFNSPKYQALSNMGDIYIPLGLSAVILFINKLLNLTEKYNESVKRVSCVSVVIIAFISFYFAIFKQEINALLWVQVIESIVISVAIGFMFASFDASLTRSGE
ncbi:MAG: hypothetical protein LIP16_09080 [Clostridium sp.]|nr:hypothetical protein [Clostridium sp.]